MTSKPSRRRSDGAQPGAPLPERLPPARPAERHGPGSRVEATGPGADDAPLFRDLPLPAFAADPQSGRILAANDAALAFYGHARDAFLGLRLDDLRPERERSPWNGAAPGAAAAEARATRHLTAAGREVSGFTHLRPTTFRGQPAVLLTIIAEAPSGHAQPGPEVSSSEAVGPAGEAPVTAASASPMADAPTLRLVPAAVADTGLLDRQRFCSSVSSALAAAARYGEQAALLRLDVDGLAAVDTTAGASAGGSVRREVGRRLAAMLRGSDMAAALGRDSFVVYQASVDSPASATALATLIIDEVGAPYLVEGRRFRLGISVGIARAPTDGSDADTLLHKADLALGRALTAGRGAIRCFDPCMSRTRCVAPDA